MIVKLISILAVLGVARVHAAATPAPNTVPSPLKLNCNAGATGCTIEAVAAPKTECGVDGFINNHHICFGQSTDLITDLISRIKNKKGATSLTRKHVEILLRYYAKIADIGGAHASYAADREALEKNMTSKITKDVIDQFAATPATVGPYLDLFSGEAIVNATNALDLVNAMPTADKKASAKLAKVLTKIAGATAGLRWLKDNGAAMVTKIKGATDIDYVQISPEAWKAITEVADTCQDITDAMLRELLKSSKHAQILKSACLENIGTSTAPLKRSCHVGLRNLPVEVFKSAPSMESACYTYLTSAQVAVLDEAKDEDARCIGYPLDEQTIMANGTNMRKDCFENAVSTAASTTINDAWTYLPSDILTFKNRENYSRISKDDILRLPASHKAAVFGTAEGCEHAPKKILAHHAEGVDISKTCFKHLKAANQVDAVIGAKIDPTVLSDLEASTVSKWEKGEDKGLAILNHALDRSDIAEIIKNLNPAACAAIETVEELRAATAIQMYASKQCFDEMKQIVGKIRLSDLQELEENARKHINMNAIIEVMDDSNYRNMDVKDFLALQDSSNICQVIKSEYLSLLPSSVLEVINGSCLAKILERDVDIERNILASIPATSFTKLEGRHCGRIKEHMTPEQFGATSSEVADLEKHFAATWTSADVTAIRAPNMKYVLASAWKAAPQEAYAGFTAQNFPAVPPSNIHVMTLEKLLKVPADVRSTLTADQAKELAPTALKAFDGIALPEPVRKIIDAALAAQKAKTVVTAPAEKAQAKTKKAD